MTNLHSGRITAFHHDGEFYLKFTGEIGVDLCMTLSRSIDKFLKANAPEKIIVDLVDVQRLDSISVGLLARLAVYFDLRCLNRPVFWCREEHLSKFDTKTLGNIFNVEAFPSEIETDIEKAGDQFRAQQTITEEKNDEGVARILLECGQLLDGWEASRRLSFAELIESLNAAGHKQSHSIPKPEMPAGSETYVPGFAANDGGKS